MKRFLIFIAFIFPLLLNAQQHITLKNAIDAALKNNFDIQISRNVFEIGKTNNTFGMAGGLPTISASAGDNFSLNNGYQKYNTGTEVTSNNKQITNLNAGVNASMVLFNGFKITATKAKLNSLQRQSELQLNLQIQNTMAAVMLKYYDIVRQQCYLKIIQNSQDVSAKKLDIVNERSKVGMANNVDILQAQMDLNSSEQNLKLQQLVIDQAKTDLLLLMSSKKFDPISVNDTIIIDKSIKLDSILTFLKQNPQYLSAEQEIKINEQIVKEISAQRYPSLRINTGYDFSNIKNDASSIWINQNYGPSAGVSLIIPIYNGNAVRAERKAASFQLSNAKLEKESLLNTLTANAMKTYQSYSSLLQQIDSQQKNYELSKELVKTVMQNFKMNQATILDVKAAQTSFENAGYLLVNLQYAAKTNEISLKQLIYRLGN